MIIKSVETVNGSHKVHVLKDVSVGSWYLDLKTFAKKLSGKSIIFVDLNRLEPKMQVTAAVVIFKHVFKGVSYAVHKSKEVQLYFVKAGHLVTLLNSLRIGSDLASKPANKLSPEQFCLETKELLPKAKVSWLNERDMERLGFGLVLAVGKGAENPPRFLKISLKSGRPNAKTIFLVGKGVIFDSGGYNLKPGSSMVSMKGDKTGGSVVVSIIHYFMKQGCAYNLVGIVPLVENMISHKAQKVGDIYTGYNGKTVEVLNTDAEGRLILADALAYSSTKHPDYILDFATLTGWAQNLHCDTSYVYFTTNDQLASSVEKSGTRVGERSIRLPNWPEYKRFTKSDIADYKNVGFECNSDGFMASMFLLNFVGNPDSWIHFDITHSELKNHHFTNAAATAIDMISRQVLQ
jgi:leucyl aminopeptidase